MKTVALVFLFVSVCYCQSDFNQGLRNFSKELFYFTQFETDGHVVISPFGIWTLMAGIAVGATGRSFTQLSRAFYLPKDSLTLLEDYKQLSGSVLTQSSGVSLISKNFVFLHNDFTVYPQFRNSLQNDFGVSLKLLDFNVPNSARIANEYIKKSGGRVSNVLRSDDFRESRMILANVISFKGLWKLPFNTSDTLLEPFYNENKEVIGSVNMMFQKGQFPFSDIQALRSYVLKFSYGSDGKYCMLVVLPYPSVKINDMYRHFSKVTLKDILKRLQDNVDSFGVIDVDVKLPRFNISTNVALNKPLNDMGVYDIFQPDSARLTRLSKDSIFVSTIIHKAEIEISASGTEASAATTATFSDKISAPYFHANRPFLYFIMEEATATVIFSGIYSKPTVYLTNFSND